MPGFPAWRVSALLGCLVLAPSALTSQQAYRIGPPASWITARTPALVAPSAAGEGIEMLLVDRQEAVLPSGIERFWHAAYRVLDEGAVQANSQIEIVFDSSYQRLILHSAVVKRDGRTINQLFPARIRVAQRETRLEYQIYDGSVSVVLLPEDVRRGDVIEYSYTRQGSNPVFADHYMAMFRTQDDVPTHAQHFRLLWPRSRALFVRRRDTAIEPVVRDSGALRVYEWAQASTPARVIESNLPAWYDPLPAVQLSDFGSWAEVAAWGDSLFPDAVPLPPQLVQPVARMRAAETDEQRVLAALRFVQDEIRYLGIEIGVNSHLPYTPATVLRRRYGDCKDKTLVLLTMLRELGLQAWPALVSTDYGEYVRAYHPTAGVFDHAIVVVRVNGRLHWIDPTALYQRGGLTDVGAGFGAALVLGFPGDSLTSIPAVQADGPLTDIAVSFRIAGVDDPAQMTVETTYRGSAANDVRSNLADMSPTEVQQAYANFYAETYPSIQSELVPKIADDETTNVLRTSERYTIPDFWRDGRSANHVGTLTPLELARAVPAATGSNRTMPLSVSHPTHIRYQIAASFEPGWSIRRDEEDIETPAARFAYRASAEGKVLTLEYEYQTLSDHVPAHAAAAHMDDMTRARDVLLYTITPPGTPATLGDWADPQQINWPVMFAGLLVLAGCVVLARRLGSAQLAGWPTPPMVATPLPPNPELTGLGGWLILVGIGVVLGPLRVLVDFASTLPQYTTTTWAGLTTPGNPGYHWLWAPVLLFELVCNVALVVFGVLLAWLFFHRKRQFPAAFVWITVARIVAAWVDTGLAAFVPAANAEWQSVLLDDLKQSLVGIVWIAYMLRSQRVRNTFVH